MKHASGLRRQEWRLEPSPDNQQSVHLTGVHAGEHHRAGAPFSPPLSCYAFLSTVSL